MKKIHIVAPATWIREEYLTAATALLRREGFKVEVAPQATCQTGITAGSDNQRIEAIHKAFSDPSTDIVLAAKGGYGTIRIIDKLDYDLIGSSRKMFLGFSDATLLGLALIKKAPQVRTFFAPNLVDIAYLNADASHPTIRYLMNFMRGIPSEPEFSELMKQAKVLCHGKAEAPLTGGTLTIVMTSLASSYEIDTKDKILFFEDTKEQQFKIDRMLAQLELTGKLNSIKGVIIGKFYEIKGFPIPFGESMETMFRDRFRKYGIPVIYDFPLGHADMKIPIPLGKTISIDTQKKNFGLRGCDFL